LIYRVKRKEFFDWYGSVLKFPLVCCSNEDTRNFLQFLTNVNIDTGTSNEIQTMVGWAHPDLIYLFRLFLVFWFFFLDFFFGKFIFKTGKAQKKFLSTVLSKLYQKDFINAWF
jgi:hypothetical protein